MTSKQAVAVGLVFVVSVVALTFAIGLLLDSYVIGVGPAIAIGAGIAAATYFATRRSKAEP